VKSLACSAIPCMWCICACVKPPAKPAGAFAAMPITEGPDGENCCGTPDVWYTGCPTFQAGTACVRGFGGAHGSYSCSGGKGYAPPAAAAEEAPGGGRAVGLVVDGVYRTAFCVAALALLMRFCMEMLWKVL